ncbi:MAG: heparinase II/III family protein [Verrucomicrobia bacterium]|nr:heparinase II/III family protein [Verrucomicrobiota bacterium]
MSRLSWYWYRLRAMSAEEIAGHVRKKLWQRQDVRSLPDFSTFEPSSVVNFPALPSQDAAPEQLKVALAADVDRILGGKWIAFGHMPLQVDDPPRWHKDYFAGMDVPSSALAFGLNHRELPKGADIKLIWELSRWYELVRLAEAAYILKDQRAAQTCIRWLQDWVKHNPSYRGWNWTSALESGMRLIQFIWIDALLSGSGLHVPELTQLRRDILPSHIWFTWRYKSFGSSANNHLLGELAGLILAQTRWPELAEYGAEMVELHRQFEKEVLNQFASDGGNREQALNYQLFSFEFCWQARLALHAAGKTVSPEVEERLQRAAEFFVTVQAERDFWDYGDSDSAYVTPLSARDAVPEWRDWLRGSRSSESAALQFWLGEPPKFKSSAQCISCDWRLYPDSGIAVHRELDWMLRFDLSPLGYLATAAHGHLDALHLSIWLKDVAFIIDPGTGAYYADNKLRAHLASWDAHNAPHPLKLDFPKRFGPFLWSQHHPTPTWKESNDSLVGELQLPSLRLQRKVKQVNQGWLVEDDCGPDQNFVVNWQFAPETILKQLDALTFQAERKGIKMEIRVNDSWQKVELINRLDGHVGKVSPAFRKTAVGPVIKLTACPQRVPTGFQTSFRLISFNG